MCPIFSMSIPVHNHKLKKKNHELSLLSKKKLLSPSLPTDEFYNLHIAAIKENFTTYGQVVHTWSPKNKISSVQYSYSGKTRYRAFSRA